MDESATEDGAIEGSCSLIACAMRKGVHVAGRAPTPAPASAHARPAPPASVRQDAVDQIEGAARPGQGVEAGLALRQGFRVAHELEA